MLELSVPFFYMIETSKILLIVYFISNTNLKPCIFNDDTNIKVCDCVGIGNTCLKNILFSPIYELSNTFITILQILDQAQSQGCPVQGPNGEVICETCDEANVNCLTCFNTFQLSASSPVLCIG